MAEEPNVPRQNEGRGEKAKPRPKPVNLAMLEAGEHSMDLTSPPPQPTPATPAPESAAKEPAPQSSAAPDAEAPDAPAEEERAPEAPGGAPQRSRLSPAEEDRATIEMRDLLIAGGDGVKDATARMATLPWILGVRAIEQAWPSLPAETRLALTDRLSEERSGDFIRLRLSVARSLLKIDPPVGTALAASVCKAIWIADKGMLTPADSKLIGNVFIGRGKPWILQLALDGLPDDDADAIASSVVFSAFNVNNPPITQLSILRYAGTRLARLHPALIALVAKGVSRWSSKWKSSLQAEVPGLPDPVVAALAAPAAGTQPPESGPAGADEEEAEVPLPPELEEKFKLATETGDPETIEAVTEEVNAWRDAQRTAAEEARNRDDRSSRGRRGRRAGDTAKEPPKKERPAYVSREQEAAAKTGGAFNISSALRQIENYVQQLRNDLGNAQAKLRKLEGGVRRSSSSGGESGHSAEEMRRLIQQLEQRNTELQTRVEELLADSEARALATAADADVTVQYRTLLKLKLQEDYSDYLSLESDAPNLIVQQHYRALVRHIFMTLRDEGVALEGDLPPPPPPPMPPLPPPPEVDDAEEDDEELDRIEDADEEAGEDAENAANEEPGEDGTDDDSQDEEADGTDEPEGIENPDTDGESSDSGDEPPRNERD